MGVGLFGSKQPDVLYKPVFTAVLPDGQNAMTVPPVVPPHKPSDALVGSQDVVDAGWHDVTPGVLKGLPPFMPGTNMPGTKPMLPKDCCGLYEQVFDDVLPEPVEGQYTLEKEEPITGVPRMDWQFEGRDPVPVVEVDGHPAITE